MRIWPFRRKQVKIVVEPVQLRVDGRELARALAKHRRDPGQTA